MDLQKHPLKLESIDIEITSNCNMRCPYCYVGTGKYPMGDMSDETIELALDMVEKFGVPREAYSIDAKGNKRKMDNTNISFYGGEPMAHFDRVERFIMRSIRRGMRLRFTALSNGTCGDPEMVNFLRYYNIWTQRSIDGHKEAQEKYRPNSWDKYVEQNAIWKDYSSSRRMTIQPEFAKDLLKSQHAFEDMGFWGGISPMPNFYTEWSDEQIQDFKNSLWDLAKYYVEMWDKKKAFYNYYFCNEISARFLGQGKFGCGMARGLHCISWDGYLYVCHRFSKSGTDGQFCFGHIKDVLAGTAKGYSDEVYKRASEFQKNSRDNWNEECKTCIANAGCEKGCMHSNYECTGTFNELPKLYCEIRKETAKIVSWMDEQLRIKDPKWYLQNNTVRQGSKQGYCQVNCKVN